MRILFLGFALAASLLFFGCAAHTSLTPLGKGRIAPHVSIGGPIVEAFDTHIPIPYLLAGAEYGVNENLNASASLHLLPLVYGVAGLDLGATWFPLEHDGWQPTLGIGSSLFAFASTKGSVEDRFFVFPVVSGSAAWETGPGWIYAGVDLAIPIGRPEYDDEARFVILSPLAGFRWNIGSRYALLTELKWHGANVETDKVVTGYTPIGKHGAVTPLIAIQRRF